MMLCLLRIPLMHPADAADIIEHLSENDRESLIKLNNFKIDPEVLLNLTSLFKQKLLPIFHQTQ